MKKKLLLLIAFGLLLPASVLAFKPATLYKGADRIAVFTQEKAQSLFSQGYKLEKKEVNLGVATGSNYLPQVIANFETSLATKIGKTDTTMTLVSGTTAAGNTLSGYYGLTIDVGLSTQEYVLAQCAGTACSSLVRGLSTDDATATSSTLIFEHRRGASVKITDFPNLTLITRILNGAAGIPDKLYYNTAPTISNNLDVATKAYVDGVAVAGGTNATNGTAGISKISTKAQAAAGTSGDGTYFYVLPSSIATSSSDVATTSVVITQTNGKIKSNFIDQTANYAWSGTNTFTGANTFSATTTLGATVFSTTPTGVTNYFGSGADGDVTITTNTSLSRDMYYDDLTINASVTLNPNGFKIYVKGNLVGISSTTSKIASNGGAGSVGCTGGGQNGAAGIRPYTIGTLPVPVAPGAGGQNSNAAGEAGAASGYGILNMRGSDGGTSGLGAGGAGGATGTIITLIRDVNEHYSYFNPATGVYPIQYGLSSSAGGGGAGVTNSPSVIRGGGGGAMGGIVWIAAKSISNVALEAKGGAGGNACDIGFIVQGAGGGGGGNGGIIILFYNSKATTVNTDITAGAGGAKSNGTSGNGVDGMAGMVGYVFNNDLSSN